MSERYRLGNSLGTGGYGEVYEAVLVDTEQRCAIKRLKSRDPHEVLRFAREVRMQEMLRHKHIVPILAYDTEADPPWLAMPLAKSNLRSRLFLQYGEGELWIFYQIAEAVQFAHQKGVVHRDLKPDNVLIFVDADGRRYAAVSDFGLGRLMARDTATLTQSNVPLGTFAYAAPEQVTNAKNVDHRGACVKSCGKA